jgi:hypothetical protein
LNKNDSFLYQKEISQFKSAVLEFDLLADSVEQTEEVSEYSICIYACKKVNGFWDEDQCIQVEMYHFNTNDNRVERHFQGKSFDKPKLTVIT